MGTTTIKPSASLPWGGAGAPTVQGGAGSHHAATNDASDSTFSRFPAPGGSGAIGVGYELANPSGIPADARVLSVRPRIRHNYPSSGSYDATQRQQFWLGYEAFQYPTNYLAKITPGTFAWQEGVALTTQWDLVTLTHKQWDQAILTDLWVWVVIGAALPGDPATTQLDLAEVQAVIDWNLPPEVSDVEPDSTVDTPQPTISATYSDTEDDAIESFEVRVFTAAQYGAGGFNPSTSDAFAESGTVFPTGGSISWTIDELVENGGDYRAYVRASDAYGYGDWEYSEFDVSFTLPDAPTITVTSQPNDVRHLIEVVGNDTAYDTADQVFEIERQAAIGEPWVRLTRMFLVGDLDTPLAELPFDGSDSADAYDYEAPRALEDVLYRVRVRAEAADDIDVYSAWVTATAVDSEAVGEWTFKAPRLPELNTGFLVDGPLDTARRETQVVVYPKGRDRPVVMRGDIYGVEGTFVVQTFSRAGWDQLEALRETQDTLLVQSPQGDNWYVSIGEVVTESRTYDDASGDEHRTVSLPFVEVDSP